MILYKYLPVERLEVLKTFLLRFSQPSALNDPYECLPSFEEIDPEKYVERVVERNKSRILKDAKNPAGVIRRQRAMKKASRDLIKEYRNRPSCLTDRYSERWKHHMNREIGILSLSKRSDSIVMWAHYASNHQGFAIGFESEHPFFKRQPDDNQDIGILQEVEYSPDRIEIRVADPLAPRRHLAAEWPCRCASFPPPALLFRRRVAVA